MFNRLALAAAAGLLATACASTTTSSPDAGGSASTGAPGAATTPAGASAVTLLNIAATSQWAAEENLVPDDPMLALVGAGVSVTDNPQGVHATCNAANGGITMRVGKQDITRVGQSATYRIRSGATTREVNGKFEASRRTPDANFAFTISSADLLGIGQLDMISFLSDKGEVEWTLVKDPAAPVQAKYIGSLKGFEPAARDFLVFCNPK
jgi:hypothetical protein